MANTALTLIANEFATKMFLSALSNATGTPDPAGYSLAVREGTTTLFDCVVSDGIAGDWYYEARDDAGVVQGFGKFYAIADDAGPYMEAGSGRVAIDANAIASAVVGGLESVSIVRLGPDFDPETKCIKLDRGNDYSADKLRSMAFGVSVPGVSLVGATATFEATKKYRPNLQGTVTILDAESEDPVIQLEWTKEQTDVEPEVYKYHVDIKDSDGEVTTVLKGMLHIV